MTSQPWTWKHRLYLSARTAEYFRNSALYGCMFNAIKQTGGQRRALESGCQWMLDNGAFSKKFTEDKWVRALRHPMFKNHRDTCLGVIVPDVVFNWRETLERFYQYYPLVESEGYSVAFATQNGLPASQVPWSLFDVLFIGGDHFHKRVEVQPLVVEAKRRGKWVHVGRVCAGSTIIKHFPWADSVDGSTFKHHPTQQKDSIERGLTWRGDFQWQLI